MAELVAKLKKFGAHLRALLSEKLPAYGEEQLTPLEKFIHFWYLAGKGFLDNRGPIRAAALTYTTLLALVPLLAVAFSISAAFLRTDEGQQQIREIIDTAITRAAPQLGLVETDEGERNRVVMIIHSAIQEIHSGALGLISVVFLIGVAISLLSTIEGTMNDIWGVRRGRSLVARVVLYWTVITLGPIFLVIAFGFSASPQLEATRAWLERLPFLAEFIYKLLPLVLFTTLFGVFFKLIPNTRVSWRAALAGALVTGLLLHLNNTFSTIYVTQVVKQHRIYGGLGLLPVFLLGLYISWIMVLLGAQIAYTFQNRRAYFLERQVESVNELGREFIALRTVTYIAQRFCRGERPPSSEEIGEHLCVPSRLIRRVVEPLIKTKLLVEVAGEDPAYIPARPLEQISYQNILDATRGGEGRELITREDAERERVRGHFEHIRNAEREIGTTITLDNAVRNRPH